MASDREGHFDGLAEDGVKRFRRPPDFWRSVRRRAYEAQLCVTSKSDPAVGETIEIDAHRYVVKGDRARRQLLNRGGLQVRAIYGKWIGAEDCIQHGCRELDVEDRHAHHAR